jgi:hypothetical protein
MIAVPSFRLDEFDKVGQWLEEGIHGGVQRGLLSAGLRLLGVIQNELIPAEKPPPIFDGAYRAAWRVDTVEGGVEVVNDMPYASVIERGARAENIKIGRAMIDALTEWARRKGLTGHAPGKRASPEARAQARQIAWAIARSMQGTDKVEGKGIFNRDGEQGLHIARKAARRVADFVGEEIRREVKRFGR